MRILFCNFEYPPLGGGGGVVTALLAEELAKSHQVTVLTSRSGGLAPDAVEAGVRVVRVPVLLRRDRSTASLVSMFGYLLSGIRAGKILLRTGGVDVINTHFALPSGPVGAALARFAGVPNVLSVHGGDLYDPSKWTSPHRHGLLRLWIRRLLLDADRVVGQSRNTLDNARRIYSDRADSVRIPLGIRRPPGGVAARSDYGLMQGDFLLVTVGRLVGRKAIDQLITLLQELGERPVKLLVIGEGPRLEALRAQAAALGVSDRVRFLGHLGEAEKFAVLRMADLFVSTSQHEGFGLVFLEAMACALPVVCYDHGGQTDFLTEGETGGVVALNDLRAFVDRCRRFADQPALTVRIGTGNVRRVEEFFIDRCAARYESLFHEVIEARRNRPMAGVVRRA
ncbi:glycogen synthase [bacterium BMS3Bbin12]|nr:glycogen synthase [bacterium BMS3Abin12]GBE47574.1 glycogen synthase [bacterium BMS3Bbin12]GBE49687.1 glycogen synthase [bacterium BMS3Bbin13]HDJ86548.1 glycosyltransferase family 1 protein [Chromatiales bacterium]HDK02535.1 glycosyltransferase family 1 protein [Gammaproteobacteria bacterium]